MFAWKGTVSDCCHVLQIQYLGSIGGRDLADTVRRVLSAVATDAVWSSYSVHGKKGKKPLKSMALFNVITRT